MAVRPLAADDPRRAKFNSHASASSKVEIHTGELSDSYLGLSKQKLDELCSEVDVIIHSGASRSFWDSYEDLRRVNVGSTKEVIRIAATARNRHGKQVAIHFLSTGSRELAAGPGDGSAGYLASKWVSERVLEKASEQLGFPVILHRMDPTVSQESKVSAAEENMYAEFVRFCEELGAIPSKDLWTGKWDLAPVTEISDKVTSEALSCLHEACSVKRTAIEATLSMDMGEVLRRLEGFRSENFSFEEVPGHKWLGRAKLAGLTYQVISMNVAAQNYEGQVVGVVRR